MTVPQDAPPPADRPRFQFSLRAQMILVTAVAVVLGLFVIVGWPIAYVLFHGVFYCLVPTPLVIGALFGRGDVRAFCIGALVPWINSVWGHAAPYLFLQIDPSPANQMEWIIGAAFFMLIASALCGVLAVATRRWLERKGS